jgi:copper ion binding protein
MCDSCSCGTGDAKTTSDVIAIGEPATATVETYTVSGMTCGHCVSSVSAEVGEISGVTSVDVDLPTGTVKVASEAPLDRAAVRAAVEEAGYELVSS